MEPVEGHGGIHDDHSTMELDVDGGAPRDELDGGARAVMTGGQGLTGSCDAMSCAGCCAGGRCVTADAQDDRACGGGGMACETCMRGGCEAGRGCRGGSTSCSVQDEPGGDGVIDSCGTRGWCACRTESGRCDDGQCVPVIGPVANDLRSTFRVRILAASADAITPDGDCVDADCSAPDLYVRVRYSPLGFGVFTDSTAGSTSVVSDSTSARWDPAVSVRFPLSYRESFYLELFDEDTGPDDRLFTCFVASPLGERLAVRPTYLRRLIRCDSAEGSGSIVAEIHPG